MNSFNESRTQTNAEHYIFATGTYKLLAFTIGTIGVLGFCNNVVVVILCYKFKRLRTPTNLLLLNISASDLLVSVIGTGFTLVSCVKQEWVWNTATCVWDGFSNSLFGIVSIMTLASLAYERYIRVVHAKVVDFPWAWRAITHIWLYSLAWVGAPLLGWNRYTLEIHQLGCSLDWASKDPNDASFIIFFLLGCFFVPTGIMAYCYGNILYAVHMLRSIEDLQTMQIIKALRYEKKVAAMFLLMILCYLLCWTPYTVVSMLEAFGKRKVVSPAAAIISSFFAKSSMMYNPVIYALMSRKRSIKDRPLTCSDQPIRPIVMSQSRDNRPKKRVTFSSSSIVFIITSNDTDNQDVSKCNPTPEINIIQVRPL
ncbi:opsin-3 isoform X2 [Brachyhypopomus gauderio]|uniref:opsin-3 isoform X2 n=1 Tax=Brachyhypopomus gauderio TaxID=698409 RepID=UPI0040425019